MFTRRRKSEESPSPVGLPTLAIDLLEIVDAEYIILTPFDVVLESSSGIRSLGIIKEIRITSQPILNLVRAVRRSGKYEEQTLALPRGPLGDGTHDLVVVVVVHPLHHHLFVPRRMIVIYTRTPAASSYFLTYGQSYHPN